MDAELNLSVNTLRSCVKALKPHTPPDFPIPLLLTPPKGKIRVQEVHHGLIDAGVTCTGLAEYFINTTLVSTVNVQRQGLGLAVNISHHFVNI